MLHRFGRGCRIEPRTRVKSSSTLVRQLGRGSTKVCHDVYWQMVIGEEVVVAPI